MDLLETPSRNWAEAAKHGTWSEYRFFDKVREALNADQVVYENFLRLLNLFNEELISKTELLQLAHHFIGKHPELMKWLADFLGCNFRTGYAEIIPTKPERSKRKITSRLAFEIDYSSCKSFGVSYRELPNSYQRPHCTGRTELCQEVLNDVWVSFPSWLSEDSGGSSSKTAYDEFVYRTEDERFELDVAMEVNRGTIEALETLQKRMSGVGSKPAARVKMMQSLFRPDVSGRIGGRSSTIIERAIARVYGDTSLEIMAGLNRNPFVALPLVLKRLKDKDKEWQKAKEKFNVIWKEQEEKCFKKSAEQQGLNYKQNDLKQLRSRYLLNQIETLFDERQAMLRDGVICKTNKPHLEITYPNNVADVFQDVSNLLLYQITRQGVQKDKYNRLERFLKQVVADFFGFELVVNICTNEKEIEDAVCEAAFSDREANSGDERKANRILRSASCSSFQPPAVVSANLTALADPLAKVSTHSYRMLYGPNSFYLFLRLHHVICQRLSDLRLHADTLSHHVVHKSNKKADVVLKVEKPAERRAVRSRDFYGSLLEQTRDVLDGRQDAAQSEERCREMFTDRAHLAFALDKLVQAAAKQLQSLVNEDVPWRCLEIYEKWLKKGGAGGLAYLAETPEQESYRAEVMTNVSAQNCFKIISLHDTSGVCFELLPAAAKETTEVSVPEWANYFDAFLQHSPLQLHEHSDSTRLAAFLARNIRSSRTDIRERWNPDRNTKVDLPSVSGVENKSSEDNEESSDQPCRRGINWSDSELLTREGLEIRLSPSNSPWRLKFVAGTGDFLYRCRDRTQRIVKLEDSCLRKHRRFVKWHAAWLEDYVSRERELETRKWLRVVDKPRIDAKQPSATPCRRFVAGVWR